MNRHNTLRERETLKLRYGWDGNKCMTFAEVGELFNITGARARQIEYQAMRRIRHTSWGLKKINEYYTERFCNSNYKIDEKIKAMDFKQKYI